MNCLRIRRILYDKVIQVKDFARVSGCNPDSLRKVIGMGTRLTESMRARITMACEQIGIDTKGIFDEIRWKAPGDGQSRDRRVLARVMRLANEENGFSYTKLQTAIRKQGYKVAHSLLNRFANGKYKPKKALLIHIWDVISKQVPEILDRLKINDMKQLFEFDRPSMDVALMKKMEVHMQLTQVFLEPEVLDYFGLARDPFDDPESPDDVYMTREMKRVGQLLRKALPALKFVKLTGRTGVGKSIAKWIYAFPLEKRSDIKVASVKALKKEAVSAHTLQVATLQSLDSEAKGSTDHERLTRKVIDALYREVEAGFKVILVVEEAHALTAAALKALKRLYEVHKEDARFGFKRALGIFLIGQLELDYKLMSPDVREVTRRITSIKLENMAPKARVFKDAMPYVEFRLQRASRNGRERKIFDPGALKRIATLEGCNTFLDINTVAGRALALAHEIGEKKVTRDIVEKAAQPE